MRKIKLFLSLLMVMLVSVGKVWADEQLAYTLEPATGSNNSYASNCDVEIDGITWNVTGNASLTPWRLGGKSLSGVDRAVYSKDAMSAAITKVELTVGTASNVTVNSLKLIVASDEDFSDVIDEVTGDFTVSSTITFEPTSSATQWATGAYYKFVFNVSVSGTSNKFVQFTRAKFYTEEGSSDVIVKALKSIAVSGQTTTYDQFASFSFDGTCTATYSVTKNDIPQADEQKEVEPTSVSSPDMTTTGEKEVTVSYTEGGVTKTAKYNITVNHHTVTPGKYTLTLNNALWGTSYTSSNTNIGANALDLSGSSNDVQVSLTNGSSTSMYITDDQTRAYAGYTLTFSVPTGYNITKIEFVKNASKWGLLCASGLNADKNTWEGEANSVAFTFSARTDMTSMDVTYEEAGANPKAAKPTFETGDESFLTSTSVTLACETTGAIIYYTTDGNDPTTSSSVYSAAIPVSTTTTIKAIAVADGYDNSAVAEKTFTKATVLTVAAAIAAIPNKNDVVDNQYVSGIVCTAGASVSSGKMTYYISDDGSETNRLQIYKGKNLNNTDFTAVSDLAIGDRVVVFGQLKNYNGTPEMNDGNYLVSKAAPAVAAPTFSPDGGGFMGETDVTISCATASSAIYYTLDGSAPSKLSTLYESAIHLNATTTITAIAYVDEEHSIVVAKTFTLTAPMTVAEALAALDSEDPINNVAVAGIISTAPTANPSSGKLTFFISDDGSASDELEVYKGFGIGGASFSDKTDLQVGDEVTVFGNLTIYNTTKEFAEGSRLMAFNRLQVDVESINLTESTAEVEEGKTVTLHASVVPANATNKTIVWSVQSGDTYASVDQNGVVTGIAAGEAVIRAASDEDATIFAECTVTVTEPAPLSPWATVYTSNVELSGSQNVKVTITVDEEDKNFDGVKMNKAAAATFTIPAGTTNLYAHMAAWNGEAQTVTVSGDCFDADKSIDIVADANISGSGTTYDIDDAKAPTDYFKEIVLDKEVTEPTEITITAASGKRFVLFGVNQVGGLVLESIAISGTATELEYNEGDHFDPAGLKVMGHYSDNSDAEITEGIDWAFDPDPLTEGTTSVSVTATAGGFTSDAFVVNGLTVNGAAPLSPWATVYTSNVELSGSQNVKVTITVDEEDKNFDGVKMNKAAAATFTIPAGTTNLYAHMAAWNGEAQTVTVSGDCFDADKSIDIVADANISGSGTTYDIDDAKAPTDYFKEIVLDKEVTEPTEITITAASGKRFVLFGVNQEGGILPVLESIEIKGDLTTKTGYKAGDALNLDGLTVEATYSLGGVAQTPVDITNDPELALTYDPLVENQTEVTITATYKGQIDDITITGLDPVASADPVIYVDPSLTVNFGSVEVGEAVPANKTITVTLTNVAAATATLGGTNPEAFSIDKTALVDGDVITISVIASTAAAASYSATITITDDAAAATEKVVNLSFAVTEPAVEETPVSTTSEWVAATEIVNGMQVLIVGERNEKIYAVGAQTSNNRTAVEGSLSEGVFTPGENTMAFTVVAQEGGTYALQASNGKYLYAAGSGSGKNYLRSQDEVDDNAKWTLSVSSATANGTNTNNKLQLNNSSDIFSCYSSTQKAIQFYVPKTTPPTPTYTEVRNGLNAGEYYTMCLDKAVTAVQGGTIWRVLSKAENGTDVILEEVEGTLDAGRPYIFFATATTLEVAYTGNAVGAPLTEGNNGLVGSFSQVKITADAANYIIYNNELYYVNSDKVYVGANRAYLNMAAVPSYNSNEPQQGNAPRRRVTMAVHSEQVATGMDALNASDAPVKVLINGQLFIIRGEKMFDAKGQLVK